MTLFPIATMSAPEAETFSDVCIVVAVIGGLLLIAGLLGEFPESEWWKKSLLYKFAKAAVIVGVLGELFADTAIFKAAEREQQITNESTESNLRVQEAILDQLKPRTVTKEQVEKISALLKGHIGTIYLYPLSDVEASQYSYAIGAVLEAAGAEVKLLLPNGPEKGFADKFNVSVSITGVTAYQSGGAHEIVDLLISSFGQAGITVTGQWSNTLPGLIDGKWVADVGMPSPTIFVGLKPVPFSRFPEYATPPELEEYLKGHPPPWEPK